ncbi:hypothetical protein HK405_001468, partial [Cladochytrium tenue]
MQAALQFDSTSALLTAAVAVLGAALAVGGVSHGGGRAADVHPVHLRYQVQSARYREPGETGVLRSRAAPGPGAGLLASPSRAVTSVYDLVFGSSGRAAVDAAVLAAGPTRAEMRARAERVGSALVGRAFDGAAPEPRGGAPAVAVVGVSGLTRMLIEMACCCYAIPFVVVRTAKDALQ